MILEEATNEAFGYWPSALTHGSQKPIITACYNCGEIRVGSKQAYRFFCPFCSRTLGSNLFVMGREDLNRICEQCGKKFQISSSMITKGHGKYCCRKCYADAKRMTRVNRICTFCGKEFDIAPCRIKRGRGKYCSRECMAKARFRGGYKARVARRKRDLGYTLLMPLEDGEDGHHVTNEFVIGIPADVHNSIGGSRKKHRTRVLRWLKANDKKKYKMVLCVLAKQ